MRELALRNTRGARMQRVYASHATQTHTACLYVENVDAAAGRLLVLTRTRFRGCQHKANTPQRHRQPHRRSGAFAVHFRAAGYRSNAHVQDCRRGRLRTHRLETLESKREREKSLLTINS